MPFPPTSFTWSKAPPYAMPPEINASLVKVGLTMAYDRIEHPLYEERYAVVRRMNLLEEVAELWVGRPSVGSLRSMLVRNGLIGGIPLEPAARAAIHEWAMDLTAYLFDDDRPCEDGENGALR